MKKSAKTQHLRLSETCCHALYRCCFLILYAFKQPGPLSIRPLYLPVHISSPPPSECTPGRGGRLAGPLPLPGWAPPGRPLTTAFRNLLKERRIHQGKRQNLKQIGQNDSIFGASH
jgi:hypothetical protein